MSMTKLYSADTALGAPIYIGLVDILRQNEADLMDALPIVSLCDGWYLAYEPDIGALPLTLYRIQGNVTAVAFGSKTLLDRVGGIVPSGITELFVFILVDSTVTSLTATLTVSATGGASTVFDSLPGTTTWIGPNVMGGLVGGWEDFNVRANYVAAVTINFRGLAIYPKRFA